MPRVLVHAALPTARAIAWTPLVTVTCALLAVGAVIRSVNGNADPLLWLSAGAMASCLVFSLRDPAWALLAAVPTSRMTRNLLRLGLVGGLALPLLLLVTALLPGPDGSSVLAPALALATSGVAVATWTPVHRDVALAGAVPLVWAGADQLVGGLIGPAGEALAWWHTDPWAVTTVAAVLVTLGRNR